MMQDPLVFCTGEVVLYEAKESGELVVRIDDLEEALQQWFDYRSLAGDGGWYQGIGAISRRGTQNR